MRVSAADPWQPVAPTPHMRRAVAQLFTFTFYTVVARHNALTEAWLRIAARGGIAATREPHVKQLRTSLPSLKISYTVG